jgi:hypothetical protein
MYVAAGTQRLFVRALEIRLPTFPTLTTVTKAVYPLYSSYLR